MSKLRYLAMVLALFACAVLSAGEKSDLKILYVGVNPDTAVLSDVEKVGVLHTDRLLEFKKVRTPDFLRFLSKHMNLKAQDVLAMTLKNFHHN